MSLQNAAEIFYSTDKITHEILVSAEAFLLGVIHRNTVCRQAKLIAQNILRDVQHRYEEAYNLEKIDTKDKLPLHESKQTGNSQTGN